MFLRSMTVMKMPDLPQETSNQQACERRQYFRAKVVDTFDLTIRVWKIQPRISLSVRPMPSQELRVIPTGLSVGGMSVIIPGAPGQALPVDSSERLRIELRYPGGELLLEGRLRTSAIIRLDDGSVLTGIPFYKPESRLGAIVNALQRAELRLRRDADALPATAVAKS
jgi:hypothetical protein